MDEKRILIYTDGSSLGNPGPGGYGVVIVSPTHSEVVELGGGKPNTTNNEMEMTAVVAALAYCTSTTFPVTLYTDSKFVINGITKWSHGWRKNGWMTASKQPVTHKSLWQDMVALVEGRPTGGEVTWQYVPGHQGVPGNERVDDIAQGFARGKSIELYRGNIVGYTIPDITKTPTITGKGQTEEGYPLYLSLIEGSLERHTTWKECEARVKGKSAKFKKVKNHSEEKAILDTWGII